jgi:hypothetical protein
MTTPLEDALLKGDDDDVLALSRDVREIARAAARAKRRRRRGTRVLIKLDTAEADAQLARWSRQKDAESFMRGVRDLVELDEGVDRLADLLGERLLSGELSGYAWVWCVESLTFMRRRDALEHVLDWVDRTRRSDFGILMALARGGDLRHEAVRIERFIGTTTVKSVETTKLWVLAKIGDARAYDELVDLVNHGAMDADHAMRAAQALSHIHGWDLPWGAEGVAQAQRRLMVKRDERTG